MRTLNNNKNASKMRRGLLKDTWKFTLCGKKSRQDPSAIHSTLNLISAGSIPCAKDLVSRAIGPGIRKSGVLFLIGPGVLSASHC